jgi:plasmid stability protein
MATLTVRNLDDDVARRLRIWAAKHGRSAEAEYREILRLVLIGDEAHQPNNDSGSSIAWPNFAGRTGGRGSPSAAELLEDVCVKRAWTLARPAKAN